VLLEVKDNQGWQVKTTEAYYVQDSEDSSFHCESLVLLEKQGYFISFMEILYFVTKVTFKKKKILNIE
jgi:hypothetical protein